VSKPPLLVSAALLALTACAPTSPDTSSTGTVPVTDGTSTETGTDTPATGTGTTTPTTSTTVTTAPTTSTGSPSEPVRFVALGDAGEANDAQFEVADAIAAVCADLGCDFALYLGDNFYDTGVSSVSDPMFETHFELPYAFLEFPFYVVLGNHDLGFDGIGLEFWKAPYYVDYTSYSDKWTMPATHYYLEWGNVALYGLNTTDIFFGLGGDQEDWLAQALVDTSPEVEWRIAFGHHPYVSNGQHGNAGNYEGIPDWVPLSEIPRGEFVEEFFDAAVCGQVDLYLSGHDHNRQWLGEHCGTTFAVSGAGAKNTDLEGRGTTTMFEDDSLEGFLWIEIDGPRLEAKFFDRYGVEDYSTSLVH
jgi:tartrate-resistant acid phosphatase type 5